MTIANDIASHYGRGKAQPAGDGWLTFCPCHADNEKPSLKVKDNGDDDVIVHCFAGCDFKEIKDRLQADGLLQKWNGKQQAAASPHQHPQPAKTHVTTAPQPDQEQYIWTKGKSPVKDEHAAKMITAYFATRGIHFPSAASIPKCFRWAEYFSKKYNEDVRCVVCAVTTLQDTSVCAIQRLIIGDDGQGGIKKTAAKMLGGPEGRACYLDRKMPVDEMTTCEGIETTLSIRQAYLDDDGNPTKNCVASMSTSLMEHFQFPDGLMVLNIGADSDLAKNTAQSKKGYGGQRAALALAERFEASAPGRVAYLFTPDDSCFTDAPEKLDFNDLMKAGLVETIRARFEQRKRLSDIAWRPPEKMPESAAADNGAVMDQGGATQWQEMLERYVLIQSLGKILDTRGSITEDSLMSVQTFHYVNAGKFYRHFDDDGKLKSKQMAEYWINSPEKQVAAAIIYRPGQPLIFKHTDGIHYLNGFRFIHQNAQEIEEPELRERLKTYHDLMNKVFHKHVGYVEDWLAYTVQSPEKRTGIMIIVISNIGLGKSLLMDIFAKVVGLNNFSNAKILDVTGLNKSGTNWGDWIYNKKICCIEEVAPEGESSMVYQVHDRLKDIVTNDTLPLNLKGGRSMTARVFANIIGHSNHRGCMKIPVKDRRIFVVDSTGQVEHDKAFYDAVLDWKNDDKNLAAVYQYWMRHKISDEFHPGQAKMTRAKRAMQIDSMTPMQAAFDYLIMNYPSDLITASELRKAIPMLMAILSEEESAEAIGRNNKQFTANIKAANIVTVGDGKRMSLKRVDGAAERGTLFAIRNASTWLQKSKEELQIRYEVKIDPLWAHVDQGGKGGNDRPNYSFSSPDGSDF